MHEPIISILAHTLCSENTCLRFKHQLYWHILRSSWSFFFCLTQFNATHETNATQCKSMQLNATHPLQRNLTQLFTYCSVIPLFQDVHVTAFLVLNASSCMSLWEFRSPCSASRIPPRIIDISCNRSTLAASLSPLPSFVAHFYCPPPLLPPPSSCPRNQSSRHCQCKTGKKVGDSSGRPKMPTSHPRRRMFNQTCK